MKLLFAVSFIIVCMISSCTTSSKIIGGYEFTQTVKLDAHWNGYTSFKIDIENDKQFSLQIIDGANYAALPVTDTILIAGSYTHSKGKLILIDSANPVNKFTLKRRGSRIVITGRYFNPKKGSINKIKNINKLD